MAFDIVFHEKERVFHLYNEKISYLMRVMAFLPCMKRLSVLR